MKPQFDMEIFYNSTDTKRHPIETATEIIIQGMWGVKLANW